MRPSPLDTSQPEEYYTIMASLGEVYVINTGLNITDGVI